MSANSGPTPAGWKEPLAPVLPATVDGLHEQLRTEFGDDPNVKVLLRELDNKPSSSENYKRCLEALLALAQVKPHVCKCHQADEAPYFAAAEAM